MHPWCGERKLLPGEGVGLYTNLDSGGENTSQNDEVYYNSTLGVIGPVTAPGVTTVFAPTFPFYTPALTTTPGTLQPGAVSAGLSLVDGPNQAAVSASLATGSIKTYLTGTAYGQPVVDRREYHCRLVGWPHLACRGRRRCGRHGTRCTSTAQLKTTSTIYTQYLAMYLGAPRAEITFQGDSVYRS